MRERIRRVALCGAGAVGSSYAERLTDAGVELVLVASGERRARLEREGLTVNGRRFAVRCWSSGEAARPVDLLVLGVKQHGLEQAIEDVRPLVGESTSIVSLLNGITSELRLGAEFGREKVLWAFVVGNDVLREGTATRYTRIGTLVFGAASNDPMDPRVLALRELLGGANIPFVVPSDIRREHWWKFMLNVGVNQVSAVLRAPYGAFARPEVAELTRRAALEVVAIAGHEGVPLAPDDVDRIFPVIATLAPDGKTSMLQDVEAGRPTEVESFAGVVVELGRKHGVPTPVNEMLGRMIASAKSFPPEEAS